MNRIIVSIQDVKTCFMGITLDFNDDSARRSFQALQKGASDIGKYPADFRLWKIGSFDMSSGKIEVLDTPVLLCDGSEFIRKEG